MEKSSAKKAACGPYIELWKTARPMTMASVASRALPVSVMTKYSGKNRSPPIEPKRYSGLRPILSESSAHSGTAMTPMAEAIRTLIVPWFARSAPKVFMM